MLARRCGSELVELPLPLGIRATDEWLDSLERLAGRKGGDSSSYRDRHLGRLARRMEWLVPFVFQHLDAGFIGDPVVFAGIKELLEFVGARIRFAVITNRKEHAKDLENLDGCPPILVWPTQLEIHRFLEGLLLAEEAEPMPGLLVTNNYGMSIAYPGMAAFEFGFPSVFRHCLYPRPFLGYQGALALLDGFANAVRAEEVNRLRYKALLEL
ncbi:MAG: hypothetical protein D6806_08155 [Deltaproteobacteria bacterium]|nr:MAG: hypothetical protein D6806_08155 [Deltaproteobacteria bacterium]